MFDLLIEALKELFDPRPPGQGNQPRPNRPRRQAVDTFGGGVMDVEADPSSYPAHPSAQPAERTYTLEDIVKKLVGIEDWDEAKESRPAAPPAEPPRPKEPPPRPRPQGQSRPKPKKSAVPKRAALSEETPALAELEKFAGNQDLGHLAPLNGAENGRSDHSLDFVGALRDNPNAARDAFVYSVIFGRPIGERPLEEF